MKKLLILANSDSAIFKFRSELIAELSKQFHIGIGIPFGQYMELIKNEEYEFFDIPINRHGLNPFEDLRLLKRYRKLIGASGLGSALEKKGLLQKLLRGMYRRAMKGEHTIFFQNAHGREFFVEHNIGSEGQYRLLPGSGVNLERFKLLPYPEDNKVKYFFIARVIKEKGIEEFLSVARRFRQEEKNAEFHICGACEEAYEEILKEADAQDMIVYHGLVKDMRAIYEESSCIVLPSYYPEGQSNVLLEGAASGRPLITTDHPGCREAVDDGVSGYLVRKRDKDDLYGKACNILFMTAEERRNMGLMGRKKMEKEFDRNIVIDAYKKRLKDACGL